MALVIETDDPRLHDLYDCGELPHDVEVRFTAVSSDTVRGPTCSTGFCMAHAAGQFMRRLLLPWRSVPVAGR